MAEQMTQFIGRVDPHRRHNRESIFCHVLRESNFFVSELEPFSSGRACCQTHGRGLNGISLTFKPFTVSPGMNRINAMVHRDGVNE
ncbi:hypothetical protein KJJ93_28755, partial [Escherichia coli]|uniref:hypothetical protein n=1 Tax=Escherichia coli TaxID=562 RepID=UPI001BDB4AF8|nr:hypothetical protein [Escherichia coli]